MSKRHLRLNARRWRLVRRRILERDGWRCSTCGRASRLEVDHRIPITDGGAPWHPDNLQALCRGCHIAKTAAENRNITGVRYRRRSRHGRTSCGNCSNVVSWLQAVRIVTIGV